MRNEIKEIHVGDEWVRVPVGYVQAEKEYTTELDTEWISNVSNDIIDEELREKILDARVEFYNLYKEGKITIINHQKQRKESWWAKMRRILNGQSTQTNQRVP